MKRREWVDLSDEEQNLQALMGQVIDGVNDAMSAYQHHPDYIKFVEASGAFKQAINGLIAGC